jgi:hypothetical protein
MVMAIWRCGGVCALAGNEVRRKKTIPKVRNGWILMPRFYERQALFTNGGCAPPEDPE